MTPEEAVLISKIVATADGRCPSCVYALVELFTKGFPGFDWETLVMKADEDYKLQKKLFEEHGYVDEFAPNVLGSAQRRGGEPC
jgi:hypothetical protein